MVTKQINSNSVDDTLSLAKLVGSNLKGGEIIELVGDLGSGKTTFVSGLVAGAKSEDIVSSPTFMIKKEYKTPKFIIYHFDFYRLEGSDLIIHELSDATSEPNSVVVIEWPTILNTPNMGKKIIFEFSYLEDINKRHIKIRYDQEVGYLIN
jgi:tRNA threonylcarbamoyladenosine biosynthesis protein TsaE